MNHVITWNYYSFTDPEGMEGWVGLVGWPIADALPTKWSHVNHGSGVDQGKSASYKPTFLPLSHAANISYNRAVMSPRMLSDIAIGTGTAGWIGHTNDWLRAALCCEWQVVAAHIHKIASATVSHGHRYAISSWKKHSLLSLVRLPALRHAE